uniref:Capping protein inhibiting regulator of actin dynamics n=1 Tax=Sinocyclocheilus grahami TaxID=75366 RepID=A0A672RE84_SINGR
LRKSEGDEGSSDEEEVPRSPLKVLAQVENEPPETEFDNLYGLTPVKSPRTKRPPPPGTIESINLDAVPQSVPRLDNTAAKHKLSVKPKNQRVSRKHRRFTQAITSVNLTFQEFHEEDLSEMQEESETQKDEEVFDLSREDYTIIHRSKEDYEPTEKLMRRRFHEEELERLELQRREQEEERKMEEQGRRIEEQRLEEEKWRRQEEERLQKEEEERKQREEEARKEREEEERRREEEERKRQEEERMRREEEERRRAEEERRQQELEAERLRLEEERKRELEERRRKEEEEAEQHRIQELEERRQREEEQHLREEERSQQEEAEKKRLEEEEERKRQQQEEKAGATDSEWKRKAEELRWREMEERQRPFTFKVSSGEKQILFQKVNLTPVTPSTGQQGETTAETREGAKASSPGCTDSPTLSSSLYVPHTAILVTGAQLCGTAVNLDQIKDTACKSLLGLSEGKKAMGTPPTKSKTSPDRKSEKNKSLYESSLSPDQSNAAVLAEWASIRSKIFKGAEDGKYTEYPDQSRRPISEDLNTVPFSHTNLRKTMSASAKFSITPARKKFADSKRNSESIKIQNRGSKVVRIADSAEECMFAKDLPSFLVPSPPHGSPKSQRSETGSPSQEESEDLDTKDEGDQKDQSGERPSPFGIKLRRTNYSLRFHNEQSAEKRKKRYSAGDSFEGVPVPLTSIDQDSDTSTLSEKSSPVSPQQEITGSRTAAAPSKESRSKLSRNTLPLARTEGDNFVPKPPLYQKPATSPKPSEGATPPPSPLSKPGRTSGDMILQRTGQAEQVDTEQSSDHKEEVAASLPSQKNGQGEEELKEKKSFFPSISIPWREKTDRRTELIKKEKPSLQARHSLDSSRTQEKETGPLWITLALQKQKGFREQQQNREDKRSQREAKLAEKQAKDRDSAGMVSPTEDKGSRSSSPPKPQTTDGNKRPDTFLARFERRDNLKKANTLPSSVTVEITDSTPSPPATKDVTKRFPPGDTTQVSTEPAWLALAKRKAKAWSDCPQIIK